VNIDIEECRECFFHIEDDGEVVLCDCFQETQRKTVFPGPYGRGFVMDCPLVLVRE